MPPNLAREPRRGTPPGAEVTGASHRSRQDRAGAAAIGVDRVRGHTAVPGVPASMGEIRAASTSSPGKFNS